MSEDAGIVFAVDDDAAAREAIASLLKSVGVRVETFRSAQEFLDHTIPDVPCCLVLDVRLPWMSGLELQRKLKADGCQIPIVFITGHGDIPMSVEAMKQGAVEFLTKPFRGQELLDAIHNALAVSRGRLAEKARTEEFRQRFSSLTAREREVMAGVIRGQLNKQIAADLGASERTIKIHRANVMRKVGADSLADLVRMAERAGI
jgi:FixJ family two-component response regulator